jgi:ParB family chromosome partitioning protein
MVAEGALSMGHARALLGLESASEIVSLAERVAEQTLSVRDTERWVKRVKAAPPEPRAPREQKQSPHVRQVVEHLQRTLGTKVRLLEKGGRGRLEIDFFSYDDLERLLTLLKK